MTETQRKWLLKYINKEWLHTDFTYAQDKQDLLETIIRKNEWYSVVWDMNGELMESQSGEFAGFKNYAKSFLFALSDSNDMVAAINKIVEKELWKDFEHDVVNYYWDEETGCYHQAQVAFSALLRLRNALMREKK